MRHLIQRIYAITIEWIVNGLILTMLVALLFAFADVVSTLVHLIPALPNIRLEDVQFRDLVVSVLNVFVVIELFSTFLGYAKTRHVRLSTLIDATAVFIIRDMLIQLYRKSVSNQELLVLAALLLIVVIARSITGRFSPDTGAENSRSGP